MNGDRVRTLVSDTPWLGVFLVALGVCGFLDAAGIVDSSQTIGQWWPLVIVAWAAIDMVEAGAVSFGGIVWSGIGVALVADVQQWTSDIVIWSTLAAFVGAAMIVGAFARRTDGRPNDSGVSADCS